MKIKTVVIFVFVFHPIGCIDIISCKCVFFPLQRTAISMIWQVMLGLTTTRPCTWCVRTHVFFGENQPCFLMSIAEKTYPNLSIHHFGEQNVLASYSWIELGQSVFDITEAVVVIEQQLIASQLRIVHQRNWKIEKKHCVIPLLARKHLFL